MVGSVTSIGARVVEFGSKAVGEVVELFPEVTEVVPKIARVMAEGAGKAVKLGEGLQGLAGNAANANGLAQVGKGAEFLGKAAKYGPVAFGFALAAGAGYVLATDKTIRDKTATFLSLPGFWHSSQMNSLENKVNQIELGAEFLMVVKRGEPQPCRVVGPGGETYTEERLGTRQFQAEEGDALILDPQGRVIEHMSKDFLAYGTVDIDPSAGTCTRLRTKPITRLAQDVSAQAAKNSTQLTEEAFERDHDQTMGRDSQGPIHGTRGDFRVGSGFRDAGKHARYFKPSEFVEYAKEMMSQLGPDAIRWPK